MRARPQPQVFLVTGSSGQIGHELVRELSVLGRVVAPDRASLDLADGDSVRAAVRRIRPTVVVNAGAYTAVDKAETERDRCHDINAVAPGILGEEAAACGATVVHYSTDYVFDGSSDVPYAEGAPVAPINAYGESKLAGEAALAASGAAHLIFRTSWVYGTRGANFLGTIRRLAREREELRVVGDQVGVPNWSRMVAAATTQVLGTAAASGDVTGDLAPLSGIYHLTAGGRTTWYEFARAILESDPAREELRCTSLQPITSAEYPTPARRPSFSLLDGAKLRDTFGITLPEWREQLSMVMGDLT